MAENNEIQAQIESKREEIQKKEDMLTKLKDDLAQKHHELTGSQNAL